MARQLYGDSYGQIAGLDLATDSARDQRFFNTLNANRQQEQLNQSSDAQQMQWAQFLAGLAAQRRAQQEQQSLAAQGLDNPHLQLAQMLQTGQLARERDALARETNATNLGLNQSSELMGLIQRGEVTPGQISSLYPDLPPSIRNRASAVYGNLASQEEEKGIVNENAADTANQLLRMERMRQAGLTAKAMPRDWTRALTFGLAGQPAVSQEESKANILADITSGKSPLPPLNPDQFKIFLENLYRNRQLQNKVQVDEQGQSFLPAELPRKYRMPSGQSAVSSRQLAPMPNTAPRIYSNEAEARADGLGTGDMGWFVHPRTGRILRARIT